MVKSRAVAEGGTSQIVRLVFSRFRSGLLETFWSIPGGAGWVRFQRRSRKRWWTMARSWSSRDRRACWPRWRLGATTGANRLGESCSGSRFDRRGALRYAAGPSGITPLRVAQCKDPALGELLGYRAVSGEPKAEALRRWRIHAVGFANGHPKAGLLRLRPDPGQGALGPAWAPR